MNHHLLSVRPAVPDDYRSIVDYFLNADAAFLVKMGVDATKLPERAQWLKNLDDDFGLPPEQRKYFYVIWLLDDRPVGHCNINKIVFGEEAYMHLHLWDSALRKSGFGFKFLKMALPYFFENFGLKSLFCEPNAHNEAPNKSLEKLGFEFLKTYETTPGIINFRQLVSRWVMTSDKISLSE